MTSELAEEMTFCMKFETCLPSSPPQSSMRFLRVSGLLPSSAGWEDASRDTHWRDKRNLGPSSGDSANPMMQDIFRAEAFASAVTRGSKLPGDDLARPAPPALGQGESRPPQWLLGRPRLAPLAQLRGILRGQLFGSPNPGPRRELTRVSGLHGTSCRKSSRCVRSCRGCESSRRAC